MPKQQRIYNASEQKTIPDAEALTVAFGAKRASIDFGVRRKML
jgi:hypothetical protein